MGRAKLVVALIVVLVAVTAAVYAAVSGVSRRPPAPLQPIDYSHRLHVGERKIKCDFCHENGQGKTAHMLIPSAQKCAICHRAVKPDSPEVEKVLRHADEQTEPAWRRVYGLPASARVHFTHVPHLRAQISCQTCHGPIQEMDRVYRAVDQHMGWCLDCHARTPGQVAEVPGTGVRVNRLTDCAVCHR
jgi:Cytochrome c7 and related cytochrome c